MALPTILVNSATGSDTAASGAGPGTALTGTNASFSAATVTLDGSPDLSGVATDGSHVLYMVTSTGVRFFTITATDDVADTVTVTPNPAGTSTGRTWAIGGKRASIGSSSSELLFDNAGGSGDAMPGWIVEMESGHAESISSPCDLRRAGDTTSGPIVLRGVAGAATLPKITVTANVNAFVMRGQYQCLKNFNIEAASSAVTSAITATADNVEVDRIKLTRTSTNVFTDGIASTSGNMRVTNCEIQRCGDGIDFQSSTYGNFIAWNVIHDCTSHGINMGTTSLGTVILGNLLYGCGGDGINGAFTGNGSRSLAIINNTINGSTSDGIELSGTVGDCNGQLRISNNILSNNGGYGLKFSNASANDTYLQGVGVSVVGNQTYNNTSGAYYSATGGSAYNACPWASGDTGLDPTFTNSGSGDFSIGTNLKSKAYPVGGTNYIGTTGSTYSYTDPGAAGRQEPASGGGAGPLLNGRLVA